MGEEDSLAPAHGTDEIVLAVLVSAAGADPPPPVPRFRGVGGAGAAGLQVGP